jgi:hypothetical protein
MSTKLCGFCHAPDPHWAFPVLEWKVNPDHLVKLEGKTCFPMCDFCSEKVESGDLKELAEFMAKVVCMTHGLDWEKEVDQTLAMNLAVRSVGLIMDRRCGPIEKF